MWMAGAVLVVSLPGIALAGWDQTFRLTPADIAAGNEFGGAVALSGNTALGGSFTDNGGGSGSAYVFNAATGTQIAKLTPADGSALDSFGASVALSGNTALIGSPLDDDNGTNSGSAYLFDITAGVQIAKLTPADGAEGDWFGDAVALSGNTALIGSWRDGDNGPNSGSAYLFNATTGAQIAKLKPADGARSDRFGYSVALSGDTALVGSPFDDDNGSSSGSAYLFNASTGAQLAKLTPVDGAASHQFGWSVAISGSIALIGSHLDDDNGPNSGSAYLFDISTGTQTAKLMPADGAAGDFFGVSVALSGNTALVGSSGDDGNGSGSGSVYIFNATTGAQLAKLTAPNGTASQLFGNSVAVSGWMLIVGSRGDDQNSSDTGSAYVFAEDFLTPDPVSGGTIAFTPVRTGVSITLDDIPSVANTGGPGSVIHVTGFSFAGPDAALFDLPGYSDVTLTAGAFDTIAYDLMFLGSDLIGDYAATLTLFTDSGNVTYGIEASVIPEPSTLALLAMIGWLSARRRG
jgi:hypothetical protein